LIPSLGTLLKTPCLTIYSTRLPPPPTNIHHQTHQAPPTHTTPTT